MHEIFISYSRADSAFTDLLIAELTAANASTWFDRRDIPVSVPWLEEVKGAIAGSSMVAVVESLKWYGSKECLRELVAAQQTSKRIVYVDPELNPAEAAQQILRTYRATSDEHRLHAELLTRSASWKHAGRPRSALAGGRLLRRLRRTTRSSGLALSPESREFLFVSGRRDRRRRFFAGLGASTLLVALFTGRVLQEAQEEKQQAVSDSNEGLVNSAVARLRLQENVYGVLRESSGQVANGKESYLVRERMMTALNIPVPDHSVLPSASGVTGFAAMLVEDRPVVADGRGAKVEVGDRTGPSARSVGDDHSVADDAGRVVLTATGGRIRGIVSSVPAACAEGTTAAVAAAGDLAATADGSSVCWWRPGKPPATTVRLPGSAQITALAAGRKGITAGTSAGEVYFVTGDRAKRVGVAAERVPVRWLAVAHKGGFVAVGHSGRGGAEVLSTTDGRLHRTLTTEAPGLAGAFSPDDRTLAVAAGPAVQTFDLPLGLSRTTLAGSLGKVRSIAWSTDGQRVWAVTDASRVSGWQWRTGTVLSSDPSDWFMGMTGPDEKGRGYAVTRDGRLVMIDLDRGQLLGRAKTSAPRALGVALSDRGDLVALMTPSGVVLRDTATGRERFLDPGCDLTAIALAHRSPRIYVACSDAGLRLFALSSGAQIAAIDLPQDGPSSIALSADDRVFTGSRQGQVLTADAGLSGLKQIYKTNYGVTLRNIAVAPEGDKVVVTGDGVDGHGGSFSLLRKGSSWNANALLHPDLGADQSRALAFETSLPLAAIGFGDGTVRLLDPVNVLPGWIRTDPGGGIRGLAFGHGGTRLTLVTRDGLLETMEACPSCGSNQELARIARERLKTAERFGLIPSPAPASAPTAQTPEP